jgi:DNA-binding beta-propeller fold protein YncE
MTIKRALTAVAIAGLVAGCAAETSAPTSASGTSGQASAAPTTAPVTGLSDPQIIAHLDLAKGQMPENVALLPDGSVAATFALARQVVRITQDGTVEALADLPTPPADAKSPVLGAPFLGGIVRADDGTLYFNYATGSDDLTGVWQLTPGDSPRRIAALPANALPNGLALDFANGDLYVADSVLSTIWRVPAGGDTPTAWATGTPLASTGGYLGVNGIKVHNGAV